MNRLIITATVALLLNTVLVANATERAVLWSGQSGIISEVDAENGDVYDVIERPTGYNRGAAYDGTYFWAGRSSNNTVAKFDKNGDIVSTFIIPEGPVVGGITYAEGSLWYLTYIEPPGELRAYHIDLEGNIIPPDYIVIDDSSFDLAWDGEYLWTIVSLVWAFCYDVNTGTLVDGFPVGDPFYETETRCIASDGNYIYTIGYEDTNPDVPNWIYKYTKTGTEVDHIYTLLNGWQTGLSYYDEGITTIQPASVGRIKAIYR
jgi:hypothetical protein